MAPDIEEMLVFRLFRKTLAWLAAALLFLGVPLGYWGVSSVTAARDALLKAHTELQQAQSALLTETEATKAEQAKVSAEANRLHELSTAILTTSSESLRHAGRNIEQADLALREARNFTAKASGDLTEEIRKGEAERHALSTERAAAVAEQERLVSASKARADGGAIGSKGDEAAGERGACRA